MKPGPFITMLVLICFCFTNIQAQDKWISDREMQFKIKIPANYSQNEMRDGTDKVLTVMSPDQNVFVRVRSMKATLQFTTDILQQVFEQNIIKGAQRIMNKDGDLHGIPARALAYSWKVDGSDAVLAVYYIIQNGFAYVIWAAVPKNQAQKYSSIADGIIDSFDLLNNSDTGFFAGLTNNNSTSNKLTVLESKLGAQVDQNYRIQYQSNQFNASTNKIHLGFSYSGNPLSLPFLVKWYSKSYNQLVYEVNLSSPNQNSGYGYGFITNNGNPWPTGEYYVEIWNNGKILSSTNFIIQ